MAGGAKPVNALNKRHMELLTPVVRLVKPTQEEANRDLDLLIYTKSTRLQANQTLDDIASWPMEQKLEHLKYMRDTIKSSWEFLDFVFEIHGVNREFTHQFVRTRDFAGIDDPAFGEPSANFTVAAFAQESQRTVNASGNGYVIPTTIMPENVQAVQFILAAENDFYKELLARGEPPQNARCVLPTAVATSIIAKASLRALNAMAEVRLCTRTQGQYQDVFRLMREAIYKVMPWLQGFIEVFCVNHGTCCFPNYTKCPIQGPLFNPETGRRFDNATVTLTVLSEDREPPSTSEFPVPPAKRSEVYVSWETMRHEATPVAKDGRTM